MTHRFDLQTSAENITITFQGHLDRTALGELEALCSNQRRRHLPLRVVLGSGTKVETELLADLVGLEDITLEAEATFLARWIQTCREARS